MIFIIKGFRTIVFIFIVISTAFRPICPPAFFRGKGNHLPLWDKVEIIYRAEHWRIRCLKESTHMLGYNDLLSRRSIELNTIWESIIKKAR